MLRLPIEYPSLELAAVFLFDTSGFMCYYSYMRKHYLTLMGSRAYGAYEDDSDFDYYGIFTNPEDPKLGMKTFIPQYDKLPNYKSVIEEKVHLPTKRETTYYSLPKFFKLAADNNPNIIDSLFTPEEEHLLLDEVGKHILKNRQMFLSKVLGHKYIKYAEKEKGLADTKGRENPDVRYKKYYHAIRLLLYSGQLIAERQLSMTDHADLLKDVRFQNVNKIVKLYNQVYADAEQALINSDLPDYPQRKEIRNLLVECLNKAGISFYGVNNVT